MDDVQLMMEFSEGGLLEDKFWEFHLANPEVYRHLVEFAFQWRENRGADARLGIKALFERVRWELHIMPLEGKPPPKLNNNHTAFYARLIMQRNPELADIFKLREQRIQTSFGPSNEILESSKQVVG